MKAALKGVLPIVPTPFAKSGEVDEVSLRKVAAHAIEAGAAALVFPGVASEDLYLSAEERRRALGLAGVNSSDPAEMVEITRMAVEAGADGIMAMAVPGMEGDCGTWFGRIAAALGEGVELEAHQAIGRAELFACEEVILLQVRLDMGEGLGALAVHELIEQ